MLASFASKPVLGLMRENLFRRIGLLAMVASGVAMFSLSGQQILSIHRARIAYVAPGDEPELQFYWGGTRRAAIEREGNRALSVEHSISTGRPPGPRPRRSSDPDRNRTHRADRAGSREPGPL